jgi:hypothetical protein
MHDGCRWHQVTVCASSAAIDNVHSQVGQGDAQLVQHLLPAPPHLTGGRGREERVRRAVLSILKILALGKASKARATEV